MRRKHSPETPLQDRITTAVESQIGIGGCLIVAVSGGVDSMVLLRCLADAGRWKVVACHFNHGLRGAESDGDASFVADEARSMGIEFRSSAADVQAYSKESGHSIEVGARMLRHAFLSQMKEEHSAAAVVLAHHADDQIETSLYNFIRGSGARGLGGMVSWDARREILRPLLTIRKSELIAFASDHGMTWREDSSNGDTRYDRNWLRNVIIPEIEARRSGFAEVALRHAEHFSALHDFVADSARKWLSDQKASAPANCAFSAEAFFDLHAVLQGEVMAQMWASAHGSRHGFIAKRAEEATNWMKCHRNGSSVYFGDETRLLNRNGWIGIIDAAPATDCDPEPQAPRFR